MHTSRVFLFIALEVPLLDDFAHPLLRYLYLVEILNSTFHRDSLLVDEDVKLQK